MKTNLTTLEMPLAVQDEFRSFASTIRQRKGSSIYLLANMTEFGKSPSIPAAALGAMGYDVAIYPVSALRSAMFAVKVRVAFKSCSRDIGCQHPSLLCRIC